MPPVIYLDNSASTPVRTEVVEAMLPYQSLCWGNPSSIHTMGRDARRAIETARQQVASLLSCKLEEIYFTPSATYANNVAILGRARAIEAAGGPRHLITSAIEHPSCLLPVRFLEANGWEVTYLPVDRQGFIDPHMLARSLKASTSIISLMWANNEVGSVQAISELAAIAQERGIFFHSDAVQMAGKLPLDLCANPVSALSLSGHKFYAPKGIGVLMVRKGWEIEPLVFGGGQEGGLFPGTEAVANIVAIGKASELAAAGLESASGTLRSMQRIFIERLQAGNGVRLTGPLDLERRLPGHVSLVLPGMEGEALVMQADLKGVCVSSASACHKGLMQPSHVVSALGLTEEEARGSLRISAGYFNTEAECRKAVGVLFDLFASLRTTARRAAGSHC